MVDKMILKLKRYHVIAFLILIILIIIIIAGIKKEAATSSLSFANSFFYYYQVALPTSLAISLLPVFIRFKLFKRSLFISVTISVLTMFVLSFIGMFHYEGLSGAINWLYLFIVNPIEVYPTFLLLAFLASLLVGICYYFGGGGLD
jgi:hypothetical protein